MLMEEAGLNSNVNGLLATPQQRIAQQQEGIPHLAEGGHLSPQDMLAELLVNNVAPDHFKDGGHAKTALEKIKAFLKHLPMPQTASLGANVAMGAPSAAESHESLQKNLQGGNYGSAAQNAYELGSTVSPYFLAPAIYDAGKYFSESATGQLAHNPAYRKQMQDVSSTPLGGALSGDTGLASHIMGQQEYAPDDTGTPSILANTRLPK